VKKQREQGRKARLRKNREEAERYASYKEETALGVINGIEKVTRGIRREQKLLWRTVLVGRGGGPLGGSIYSFLVYIGSEFR